MMAERWRPEQVFVYRYPVDMRKQIGGLAALVATELGQDPADRSMFVFTNRGRDKIKLLIWHLNGLLAAVQAGRETAFSMARLV